MPYELKSITVQPGVAPSTDFTPQSTPHYVFADKVRFVDGYPEKIGGWDSLLLTGNFGINGVPRMVYSYILANITYYLIGTHTNLYSIVGNTLFNATPVIVSTTTLNNVLGTFYATLGSNPFTTVSGSTTVTVTDAGHPFLNDDIITFSGASTFAGLASGDLNGAKSISNVTANTYQFTSGTVANASTSGGGAVVVRTSRIISVVDANTYTTGDNISVVSVASAVGGIATANITGTRVLRSVTSSGYNIEADANATSSVSGAGGDFVFSEEIPNGTQNSTVGSGYGLGQYGVGLYGVAATSSSATLPTIWSADRFGNLVVTTMGTQTGLYSWASTTTTLPVLVTNAPTAINYVFVTDNICVTLGASNTPNRIKWCDQGNLTTWTATAQNQAGEDDVEGAGRFISHAALRGFNLLWTQNQTYSFRYIGKPNVFETKLIDASRGLIAQNARVVVDGVAYWMSSNNFCMYRGGNVEIVPSNTTDEATIKSYVFGNIDPTNVVKAFAWYNSKFNEVWFHYPSNGSTECDRLARLNVLDKTWAPDTMNRTAGEYPTPIGVNPYLATSTGTIYKHESGTDDNGSALAFSLTTPYFTTGAKDTLYLGGVYNDNTISTGNIDWTINVKRYPNQTAGSSTYAITTSNANLIYRKSARYWQYNVSGDTLGQAWRAGVWMELIKQGSKR